MTLSTWRHALWFVAAIGAVVALLVRFLLPEETDRAVRSRRCRRRTRTRTVKRTRRGFGLLVAIGMLDNASRPAFLVYLPFLLKDKGAVLTTIGLAFSLVFIGGALGKASVGGSAPRSA